MRCPHCDLPNEEGAAVCDACGTPLTFYGRQVTGEVSEATRAKAARLAVRPTVVPYMVAFCALFAVLGPFWRLAARFAARTQVNQEGTNYLGAAFGALGVTFAAALLIPLGVAILVVAWGILTQRTWSWTSGLLVLVIAVATAFTGAFFGAGILKLLVIAAGIGLAIAWMRSETREWFGAV